MFQTGTVRLAGGVVIMPKRHRFGKGLSDIAIGKGVLPIQLSFRRSTLDPG